MATLKKNHGLHFEELPPLPSVLSWGDFVTITETNPMYYDRQGNQITLIQWTIYCEQPDYKIIKKTQINEYQVSTIWLGLDHSFYEGGPPIIFETMILRDAKDTRDRWEGHPFEEFQARYPTEKDAILGHEEACDEVRRLFECLK